MSLGEFVAWGALVLVVILSVLLGMQSARIARLERQYRTLMKGAGPTALSFSLGDLVANHAERLETARIEIDSLKTKVGAMESPVARSVQCVGLVRFNPFNDTGGDQSFAVALLDKVGDGLVLSSLHGRTATRFYAKPVRGGTSQVALSEEEQQAIQQALARRNGRTGSDKA